MPQIRLIRWIFIVLHRPIFQLAVIFIATQAHAANPFSRIDGTYEIQRSICKEWNALSGFHNEHPCKLPFSRVRFFTESEVTTLDLLTKEDGVIRRDQLMEFSSSEEGRLSYGKFTTTPTSILYEFRSDLSWMMTMVRVEQGKVSKLFIDQQDFSLEFDLVFLNRL